MNGKAEIREMGSAASAWWVVVLSLFLVGWAVVDLAAGGEGFALAVSDKLHGEEEAISAVARLFAALVLWLSSTEESGPRLRWVAAGLVVLGFGNLAFGHLEPLIERHVTSFNESLYEGLVTRTFASALLAIGLVPKTPYRLSWRMAAIAIVAWVAAYTLFFEILDVAESLPQLARVQSSARAVEIGTPFGWLTPWHWVISALPLALAVAAAAGAFRQNRRGRVPDWLLAAVVLEAGSLLHEYMWPSTYGGEVLTTADMLRLAFAAVVAVGGIFELRRIANERAALLASERERVRRMRELAALKADFSAMVAHELGGPLSSIRVCNDMLGRRGTDPEVLKYATSTIHGEIEALGALVSDVRAAAAVERDDFSVDPRPLPLGVILADAESYASVLPGSHPVQTSVSDLEMSERVLADPKRIAQVLRNLLSNAAKYSAEGTPIEIRASRRDGRVRVEVVDRGQGIVPEDLTRIFGKFERGSSRGNRKVSGVGLGLYLSRRIMQSHGSDLTVDSKPGEGSVFGFDLEVER
jgi:signal transduction histidine kinase